MQNRNRVVYVKSAKVNDSPEQITNPVLSYLKWQLLILKSIGILPFYSTLNFYEIGAPNRRWLLISKTIICTKAAFNLLHLYSLLSPAVLQMLFLRSKTDGITNMLDVAFCMLSDVTISWSCACNTTEIIIIINCFMKVDQLLKQYPASAAQRRNNINLYNTYLLLAFGYIFIVMMAFVKRTVDALSIYYCIYISFYQLENAASCAFAIFISSLMHLLKERFQYINQLLSQYNSKVFENREYSSTHIEPILDIRKNRVIYSEMNLRLFAENSKLIYRLHNDLLDIFKMINSYAGLGLLAFLLYACYGLLSCTYGFALYDWQNNPDLYNTIWTVSWIPLYGGMLVLLAYNCDSAAKEANKATQVLARVYGNGKEYKNIIDKFLVKSIKQDVHFTAYGFFVIGNTTLFKIFSAVTTYLVILIQFKKLEETKDK